MVGFLWDWLVWSPCCPRVSQESSLTPRFKNINFLALSLLYGSKDVKAIFFPVVKSGRESRVIEEAKKSWFFWIVVLECHNWIESPLGSKEIKPINPKGNQLWIFIGRTDAKAEAPILWPRDEKSWLIGKDPDGGKDWRQKKKGATEDEIVR